MEFIGVLGGLDPEEGTQGRGGRLLGIDRGVGNHHHGDVVAALSTDRHVLVHVDV